MKVICPKTREACYLKNMDYQTGRGLVLYDHSNYLKPLKELTKKVPKQTGKGSNQVSIKKKPEAKATKKK